MKREKTRIGVVGIGRSVGATTVALLIAKALSEERYKVAFAEIGNPLKLNSLIYDRLAIGKRFSKEYFNDLYDLLKNKKPIRNLKNIHEGINWALVTPKNREDKLDLNVSDKLRLISNIYGDIGVFDISDDEEDILNEMDLIILVIDPSPGVLLKNEEKYDMIYKRGVKRSDVIWVINKFNRGVRKSELNEFLKLKNYYKIGYISPEKRYQAEYDCKFIKTDDDITAAVHKIISAMDLGI